MTRRAFSNIFRASFFLIFLGLFASCENLIDKEEPQTEWYVSLPASGESSSSTGWTQSDVVKYVVTLSQSGRAVLSAEGKPGAVISLNSLAAGLYDISVEGVNEDDEVIADGGGTAYLEMGKVANITVKLSMRENDHAYTVTYNINTSDETTGDLPTTEQYLYHDEVTVEFPALSRTGYSFDGWNTASDGSGTSYKSGGTTSFTMKTANIVLYAQWIPYTYTVVFDSGSSAASGSMSNLSCTYGKETSLPQNAYFRTGYEFVGWSLDSTVHGNETALPPFDYENGATVKNLTAVQGGSVTLYAKWIARVDTTYKVEHYQQNIDDDDYTLHETENKTGTAQLQTAAEAKVYAGFDTPTITQETILADGSTVVKIYYNRKTYTVNYEGNGTGVTGLPATKSYRYESSVKVESDIPVRTGYTFLSWQKDTDTGTTFSLGDEITSKITADITMHANWQAITYKVAYAPGALDASGTMAETEATYDQGFALRTVGFTRSGYNFAGWARTEGGTKAFSDGESVNENLSSTQGAVVTLWALWGEKEVNYTVKHYQQPASGSRITSDYELKDTETLSGKTGDQTLATAKTYAGFDAPTITQKTILADGSTTVQIYYDRSAYTLTFNKNAASATGSTAAQSFYYGVAQNLTPNGFVRTGYGFAGWATSETSEKQYADGASYTIGATNANLYATWKAESYTVTLSALDATTAGTGSVTATYDSAMPALPALPARTGYTFAGFFSQSNGGGTQYYSAAGESLRAWDTASNTTLYAKWVESSGTGYTVKHLWQNTTGDASTDYTLHESETLTGKTGEATAATAKNYAGFNAPTVTQGSIAADGSTVVEIRYTRKTFSVTYTAGSGITSGVSGMPSSSETYRYGASVTVTSTTPTRSGYTFNGWNLDSDTATTYKSGDTVANEIDANHTLTAVWSAVTSISIEIANPEQVSISKSASGKTITLTLTGATTLVDSLTKIDGVTATSKAGVSISGNQLICDTTSWTVGSYQVTLYATVNGIPQSATATIKVE